MVETADGGFVVAGSRDTSGRGRDPWALRVAADGSISCGLAAATAQSSACLPFLLHRCIETAAMMSGPATVFGRPRHSVQCGGSQAISEPSAVDLGCTFPVLIETATITVERLPAATGYTVHEGSLGTWYGAPLQTCHLS